MTIRSLEQLLAPKSVALIGASAKGGSVGLITTRNLLRGGFGGPISLVNPKYGEIEGHPCHPSIAALPAAPQLAVVATPPQTVSAVIGELASRATRAAVVITAGVWHRHGGGRGGGRYAGPPQDGDQGTQARAHQLAWR